MKEDLGDFNKVMKPVLLMRMILSNEEVQELFYDLIAKNHRRIYFGKSC